MAIALLLSFIWSFRVLSVELTELYFFLCEAFALLHQLVELAVRVDVYLQAEFHEILDFL